MACAGPTPGNDRPSVCADGLASFQQQILEFAHLGERQIGEEIGEPTFMLRRYFAEFLPAFRRQFNVLDPTVVLAPHAHGES